ncbi:hypothetical protein HCN51_39455 [Nonomuraea sp. FMUSA5-5]|uniref:Uncharacterized protein n=1 Tax=Nonomuraea composti TaxID=2720023 RepID=A0ABX1BI67_9ACTN|nr:hypothetical protein [Nonomuraea sp. FMUSA5-5]NJP95449.1 hypothetical protein [Nonomuraea sp. FMUSA5-5]
MRRRSHDANSSLDIRTISPWVKGSRLLGDFKSHPPYQADLRLYPGL